MKIKNPLKLVLFLAIFAIQCKNTPQKSSSFIEEQLFYFKTTECMGTCPVFTFTVFANGACSYQGVANVDKLGIYTGVLTSNQLKAFKEGLSASDFFNIDIKNNTQVKDLPSKYLYYKDGDKEKTIMYYHPKNKEVDRVIELADRLIKDIEWSGK